MKFGFNAFGYRFEVAITILQKKALLDIHVAALAPPELATVSVTALTVSVTVGITKAVEPTPAAKAA
jgi:hypothetical protein